MKKINRVGEKYITSEGYTIEIVEYFGAKNCTVQFCDGTTLKNKRCEHIVDGKIKNPHHKSVFNMGFTGVGKYSKMRYIKIYTAWVGMLQRCYTERHSSYLGCAVYEDWHNFQNFAKWHEENCNLEYMNKWELDKDILIKGNKIYSPETCCFVPHEINSLILKCNSLRGKYPIGVSKVGNRFRVQVTINNIITYAGTYDTIEEAFQAYKTTKEKHIKQVADKWKDRISEKVYNAMYNYQVEMTD